MPEDRDIRYNERARQRAIKAAQKNRDSKEWHKAVGIMKLFEPASTNLLAEAELAQELSHDLHTRYIDKQLKKAEAEVRKEHAAMRKISGAWSGMGALEVFEGGGSGRGAKRNAERRTSSVPSATNSSGPRTASRLSNSRNGRSTSTRLGVPTSSSTRLVSIRRGRSDRVERPRRSAQVRLDEWERRGALDHRETASDGLGRAVGRSFITPGMAGKVS